MTTVLGAQGKDSISLMKNESRILVIARYDIRMIIDNLGTSDTSPGALELITQGSGPIT